MSELVSRLMALSHLRQIRDWLVTAPGLSAVYSLLNPRVRAQRVTESTALVIDGFPRSANGFASYALRMLLGDRARMSTLTHVPDTIIRASRLDRPCVLLIREPDAVVASLLTYDPRHTPASAFTAYARYYERLAPVASRVVVADFELATRDLPELVRRLNARYGTTISEAAAAEITADDVFARLDSAAADLVRTGEVSQDEMDRQISRPVEGRRRVDVTEADAGPQRARARRAYDAILDASGAR